MGRPQVVVLADDLIWQTRLSKDLEAIGAHPVRAKSQADLEQGLVCAAHVVVDVTATHYDPIAAIRRAHDAGARVLAVGQHDDLETRRRALAAGAERVYAYRKLFEDGPGTITAWLDRAAAGSTSEVTR